MLDEASDEVGEVEGEAGDNFDTMPLLSMISHNRNRKRLHSPTGKDVAQSPGHSSNSKSAQVKVRECQPINQRRRLTGRER